MKIKFIILTLTILTTGITGCNETKIEEEDIYYSDSLIGEWDWIRTMKMIPPSENNPLTPKNTGITEAIIFNTDSTWEKIKNNVIIDFGEKFTTGHGVYEYYEGNTVEYDSILFIKNGIPILVESFQIKNNRLGFSSDFAGHVGGGSKWFERRKQ